VISVKLTDLFMHCVGTMGSQNAPSGSKSTGMPVGGCDFFREWAVTRIILQVIRIESFNEKTFESNTGDIIISVRQWWKGSVTSWLLQRKPTQ